MSLSDIPNQIILPRNELKNTSIDTGNRTIIIGFNEPRFRKSNRKLDTGDVDSPLNARMITHFLPAVEVARMQRKRPRFFLMSAINSGLRWNADTEEQKKIMVADNAIKMDFLKHFFEKFFPETFSLIEYVIPQDILKISEEKLLTLWRLVEIEHAKEIKEVRFQLTKFLYPRIFNVKTYDQLSKKQLEMLNEVDASLAFKYAISHLFVLGDINFDGNYVHNPSGYVSIGGYNEIYFNKVRDLVYKTLKSYMQNLFGRDFILFDNMKIVLQDKYNIPVSYNGMFDKRGNTLEVTYETGRSLDFYDKNIKTRAQMEYMYENLVSKKDYQDFWDGYKERYFDLKKRYREAYGIGDRW